MPLLNQTRRDSVGSQTISKYGLGGGVTGAQAVTYIENPSSADTPPDYEDIRNWPGTGLNVVLDDGSTSKVTSALLSVASILPTTIAPGAVLATSTGFRGLPWQVHTAELELVQSPLSPFFQHSTSEWEIFRLDYTTFSEGAFSPSNASPSTQAYGVSIGTTGQTGRWWSNRLAVESARLPSPSPDIHIFPQDINFAASDSGSLFVAVRVGSSVSLGSLGLYSWGYNGTAWRSRNHLFTSTSLGTCSTLALAPNIIAASNIINGAVTSAKMAVGAVLSTTIAAGAVLSTSIGNFAVAAINLGTNAVTTPKLQDASVTPAKTSFASDAWRDHNGALQVLQKDFTPGVVKSSDSWTLYRVNYTLASSTTFTPTNTASLESYGIALGGTGDVGRWWSNRLAVASTVLPTQSPDLHIFGQDIDFLNPAGSGSFFVAAKNGSAMQTALTGGTLTLRTWGYSVVWTIRTHSYTTSDLGEISAQTLPRDSLLYFTESEEVGPYRVLSALATGETSASIAIKPLGTNSSVVFDTGGSDRGAYAVDFQRKRAVSDQIAAGQFSAILNGENSKAPSSYATVINGSDNHANGAASVVMGMGVSADKPAEIAFGGYGFQGRRSSQATLAVIRSATDILWQDKDDLIPLYFGDASTANILEMSTGEFTSAELQIIASVKNGSTREYYGAICTFACYAGQTGTYTASRRLIDPNIQPLDLIYEVTTSNEIKFWARPERATDPSAGTTARVNAVMLRLLHIRSD